MQIKSNIKLYGNKGIVETTALFDTGARSNFLDHNVAEKIGYERVEAEYIPTAVKDQYAKIIGEASFKVEIDGFKLLTHGYVIENLREPMIIGTSFIEEYDLELDLKVGKVRLRKIPPEVVLT